MADEGTESPGRQRGVQVALTVLSTLLVAGGMVVLYLDYDPGCLWFGGAGSRAYLILHAEPPFFDIGSRRHHGLLHVRLTWLGGTLVALGLFGTFAAILRRT